MENRIWKERITRKFDDMTHRASLNSANVVDFLIQNDVISPRIKQDLEKLEFPVLQMDHLKQVLINKGESACQTLIEYLEKNSFGDDATKVKKTNVFDAVENHGEQDNDSLASSEAELRCLSDSDDEYKNDNQNASEFVDDNNSKVEDRLTRLEIGYEIERAHIENERKLIHQEREEMRKEKEEMFKRIDHLQILINRPDCNHDDMKKENIKLKEQVQRLHEEFTEFKSQTKQETAERNKLHEQLMQKNKCLLQKVETLKRRVERREEENKKFERENKDLKIKLDDMKRALGLMVKGINKTENGKRVIEKVQQKCSTVKLPHIDKKYK